LEFYRAQLTQQAEDRFAPGEVRDTFLARAIEHANALCLLAEELAPPEQRADLVAYLSWRTVYMARREDGVYTPHPTIQ
jgi:hypothetical protein